MSVLIIVRIIKFCIAGIVGVSVIAVRDCGPAKSVCHFAWVPLATVCQLAVVAQPREWPKGPWFWSSMARCFGAASEAAGLALN